MSKEEYSETLVYLNFNISLILFTIFAWDQIDNFKIDRFQQKIKIKIFFNEESKIIIC